jgi:hypothetical protein
MSRVHEPCEPLSVLVLGSIMDPAMADADTWLVLRLGSCRSYTRKKGRPSWSSPVVKISVNLTSLSRGRQMAVVRLRFSSGMSSKHGWEALSGGINYGGRR